VLIKQEVIARMNKKSIVKIIIPVCVILIIAGIWIIKNADKSMENPIDSKEGSNTHPDDEVFALEISSLDLEALKSHELPIILDFGADYCPPCREMKPALKAIHEQMLGKAIVKYIDVEKSSDIASDFPIQVIPTQIFINADGSPYIPGDKVGIEFTRYSYRETGEHAFTVHQGGLTLEQMQMILKDMGVAE
jgi:thioredoxin 1